MFGFKKATVLAALSLFLSAGIFHYCVEEKYTRGLQSSGEGESRLLGKRKIEEIDRLMLHGKRNLLLSAVHTILSSILKFLFESPLSGKNVKTLSCFAAFGLAGVDFAATEKFSDWFDHNSLMNLYAAGIYEGLDGIKEYVDFLFSDDFAVYEAVTDLFTFSEITDESDVCNITYVTKRKIAMADFLFPEDVCYETSVGATARFTITGDENFVYIDYVNIFYPALYLVLLAEDLLDGAIAERVCGIMEENCVDTWEQNAFADQSECKATVDALPITEGGYINGPSQGCRWLHSVFATENEDHCAHISSIPLEDPNGKIKCQTTDLVPPESVFSSAELDFFEQTSINELGLDESMVKRC